MPMAKKRRDQLKPGAKFSLTGRPVNDDWQPCIALDEKDARAHFKKDDFVTSRYWHVFGPTGTMGYCHPHSVVYTLSL